MKKTIIGPPPRRGRNGVPKLLREMAVNESKDVKTGLMATWYAAAKAIGATVTIQPLSKKEFRVWRTG